MNSLKIYKNQIKYNITKKARKKEDIKAIVIHYTANYNKTADDRMHFKYWNTGDRNSSCDIVIDDDSVSIINDWYKFYTWQIGDGRGRYGYYNNNVIGIEICVNKDIDKAVENTIWYLRGHLLKEFDHIDKDHLIRHYDASRKLCPVWMVDLTIKEVDPDWIRFKNEVFSPVEIRYNWTNIIEKETTNFAIWIGIINALIDIGNGKASGFETLFKYKNSLKYFGELLVKISENDNYKDVMNSKLSNPQVWHEVIHGLVCLGNNKSSGIELLAKNIEYLKYFGEMIEKIDK